MKHHIMIALGLLMTVIFGFRMANAVLEPGLGFSEAYLAGGLILAAWLIFAGLKERRFARSQCSEADQS